nr:ClassC-AmpC_beta_lactamase [uncultured bacterium]
MKYRTVRLMAAAVATTCVMMAATCHAADESHGRHIVNEAVRPAMEKYDIPGMAVGIAVDGASYIFNYGVASRETRKPVDAATLFEIGSISKTFTVTLASLAEVEGHLSWSDKTSQYLPSMKDTPFGDVRLLYLATHTPGGFPLQLPDDVTNDAQLTAYLEHWKPAYKAGTMRTYANPSIGMLGRIAARSMDGDFAALMEHRIFAALGLSGTYLHVPKSRMPDYAQGYTKRDEPARMTEAVLSSEAYGVRSTASDMLRFLTANMGQLPLQPALQRAITATHTSYFRAGVLTQDLIWEQYDEPVALDTLLRGNSSEMAYNATPAAPLIPPQAPRADAWINKTGSTNGFGAYVAFIPERRLAIVLLANKNYPNDARVALAHEILSRLARKNGSPSD